jgi:hypothetical protein
VELVGSHHARDLVAPLALVVGRDAREEAGDLEQQLGAVGIQELVIVGDLVIAPDVVGDRGIDVALATLD